MASAAAHRAGRHPDKDLDVYVVDGHRIARDHGLGGLVNTVMQACFLALTGLFGRAELDELLVASARRAYAHKGEEVVAANTAAIRDALATGLTRRSGASGPTTCSTLARASLCGGSSATRSAEP